jgi:FkbM family methyltransferase
MNISAALSGFGKDSRKSIDLDQMTLSVFRLLTDHARRSLKALAGFKLFGREWLRPWISYSLSPLLNRFLSKKTIRFGSFNVRRGECDLYTFANIFEDYRPDLVRRALQDVDLVLDLGANVGAFSFLVTAFCDGDGRKRIIRAVEPNPHNVEFLRNQPFADAIEIHEAAIGPVEGTARLIHGTNSVTDHVDFSATANGFSIRVIPLEALCDQPALAKMDVEGSEWEILRHGLPMNVRHLFLEWHPNQTAKRSLEPADLIPGDWQKLACDPHGATMWYFHR